MRNGCKVDFYTLLAPGVITRVSRPRLHKARAPNFLEPSPAACVLADVLNRGEETSVELRDDGFGEAAGFDASSNLLSASESGGILSKDRFSRYQTSEPHHQIERGTFSPPFLSHRHHIIQYTSQHRHLRRSCHSAGDISRSRPDQLVCVYIGARCE